MTDIRDFPGYEECEKINPACIDAYVEIKKDPENDTGVILESSWGRVYLDIKSIVKAGETITHIELAPSDEPTVIRYFNEAGDIECISGDDLSRIISLQLLKDVDQTAGPSDGIVYMYNEQTELFEPYDLKTAVADINTTLGRLQASITNLQNRVTTIEEKLTPPTNTPSDAHVAFANINFYGDHTNTNSHQHGVFAHDPTVDVTDDNYFS